MTAFTSISSERSSHRIRVKGRLLLEPLEARTLFSIDFFVQANLHSDGALPAVQVDPPANVQLVNPWGLSYSPTGPFWVSDNGTGISTLYNGSGTQQSLVVSIPGAGGAASAPTGQIFNSTTGFTVSENGKSAPALFIFTGEDGEISGWNPAVDATHAILMVDHSADGAVFKGITNLTTSGKNFLLAADFHNGKIDIFNSSFLEVTRKGAFVDRHLPKGFAPFNVQNIGGQIYVTYAKQDADKHDDVAGAGNGFVDVFASNGKFERRLQSGSFLNSPWGVTIAPKSWDNFAGDILVGNFGSGRIDVFSARTGRFLDELRDTNHNPIVIDGLWALKFGNGGQAGDADTLFFTAGTNDEADGLFGSLTLMVKPKHHK